MALSLVKCHGGEDRQGRPVDKPVTLEMARAGMIDGLHRGDMMVHLGDAGACVAGAENTTGDVMRAGLARALVRRRRRLPGAPLRIRLIFSVSRRTSRRFCHRPR